MSREEHRAQTYAVANAYRDVTDELAELKHKLANLYTETVRVTGQEVLRSEPANTARNTARQLANPDVGLAAQMIASCQVIARNLNEFGDLL